MMIERMKEQPAKRNNQNGGLTLGPSLTTSSTLALGAFFGGMMALHGPDHTSEQKQSKEKAS